MNYSVTRVTYETGCYHLWKPTLVRKSSVPPFIPWHCKLKQWALPPDDQTFFQSPIPFWELIWACHMSACVQNNIMEKRDWMNHKISRGTGKAQDKWALNKINAPKPPHKWGMTSPANWWSWYPARNVKRPDGSPSVSFQLILTKLVQQRLRSPLNSGDTWTQSIAER